ncbi:MAG TPA: pseudouridine-5'-phosphate glycosidase [Gammaproteobacteria bacterium]|nr:pseudouridine-5'-phosphate glycosidase [Gammaproteobacteria bacterium]
MLKHFEFSAEVQHALENKKPVLALESTLITHGFPHPHNLEIAQASEEIAREHNVTPATIAILNGKIKIGLTADELNQLVADKTSVKASKRDIPYVVSQKLSAGTTVAATMFCAHAAGIRVFATGGIGGVHRGDAFDISADLIELSCSPVAVVCAGAKSILDLPRTLEYLETYSIPVIGYGCDTLPAFYTASTSHKLSCRVDDVSSLSNLLKIHWQLGMKSGILITNPINARDEIPAADIDPVIASALKTAAEKQITGKDITPFLLNEIVSVTKGKSMTANISLIKNNIRLGAELAASL